MLQSTRAKINQYSVETTCSLCRLYSEDSTHLLLICPTLFEAMKVSMRRLNVITF